MVAITVSGIVTSEVSFSAIPKNIERASFIVESNDTDSLPLRFSVLAFGTQAKRAATFLKPGTRVNLCGRMEARQDEKRVTVALSAFEVQEGAKANGN
jgi:single-stranded DNA-binding protein